MSRKHRRHLRWQWKLIIAIILIIAGYTELIKTQADIVSAENAYAEVMKVGRVNDQTVAKTGCRTGIRKPKIEIKAGEGRSAESITMDTVTGI